MNLRPKDRASSSPSAGDGAAAVGGVRGVGLGRHEDDERVGLRIRADVVQPLANMVEGLAVCHVVDQQAALSAAVELARDRPKTLLARRIPDLQLYVLAVDLKGLDHQVDTNRGNECSAVVVVDQTVEQSALTHAGIP